MRRLLEKRDLILMEASIIERLRRSGRVNLHPRLENAPLVYDEQGRLELTEIYQSYIDVAVKAGLPLLLCSPTWRTSLERVLETDISRNVNNDAVRFVKELRGAQGTAESPIKVGALLGPKNDCYRPEEGLLAEESRQFHSWQVGVLAKACPDFMIAATLPNVEEAAGLARAMEATGLPYIVSFVIDRTGRVLDGTPLSEAATTIDAAVERRPLGYMVNCAHPSFLCAAAQPSALFDRLIGYQANASSLDHADLDGADSVDAGNIPKWGDQMLELHRRYGVRILGGCCGTGAGHIRYLADKSTG